MLSSFCQVPQPSNWPATVFHPCSIARRSLSAHTSSKFASESRPSRSGAVLHGSGTVNPTLGFTICRWRRPYSCRSLGNRRTLSSAPAGECRTLQPPRSSIEPSSGSTSQKTCRCPELGPVQTEGSSSASDSWATNIMAPCLPSGQRVSAGSSGSPPIQLSSLLLVASRASAGWAAAASFGPAASIGVESASSATRRGSSTSKSGRCGRYSGVPPMICSGSTRARRRTASGSTPLPSTVIATSPTWPIATHCSPAEANSNGRLTPSTRNDFDAVTISSWRSRSRRLRAASSSTSWASISESTATLRESSTSWLRVSDDTGSPSPPPHPVSSTFSPSGAKTGKSTPARMSRCSASHSSVRPARARSSPWVPVAFHSRGSAARWRRARDVGPPGAR